MPTATCIMIQQVENLECPLLPADPTVPLSNEQLYAVFDRADIPDELHFEFLQVARCESLGVPAAQNLPNLGLFQVVFYWPGDGWEGWYQWSVDTFGYRPEWSDPVDNARLAYQIYDRRDNWGNWPNCQPRLDHAN